MKETYFPDGFYTFYTTNNGQRVPTAEIAIFDDEVGYPSSKDKFHLEDVFPEGKIDENTKAKIEKFLHDQHGHAHLEFGGSGGEEVESNDGQPEENLTDTPGSESSAGPAGGSDADDQNEGVP